MFETIRRDAARYREYGGWWQHLGFWTVATYRLGTWARGLPVPGVRHLLLVAAWLVKQPFRLLLHVELPSRTRIGPGFALIHPYNVLVGPGVEIGEDCTVYHEVTLGSGPVPGEPRLERNVVLFAGARVFGGVVVGASSEVGANCVVTKDVPAMSLVMTALPRTIPQSLVRKTPRPDAAPQAAREEAAR